jgi:hypothetical protein
MVGKERICLYFDGHSNEETFTATTAILHLLETALGYTRVGVFGSRRKQDYFYLQLTTWEYRRNERFEPATTRS